MANVVTALATSDTFRTWLAATNTVIDLINSSTVPGHGNTVVATINAIGTFAIGNTTHTNTSLTIYHANSGQTLANSTGLFLSGNTTFSGLNFTANATSNVFTVSSNTTLLESLGGTTINSTLVASKTLAVTGNTTLSGTLDVTGVTSFTSNVTVANNLVASNTVYAKAVLFSETGAVVSHVQQVSADNYTISGLDDASVLRINSDVRNIKLTGLVAPTNLTTLVSGGNGAKVLYLQNSGGTYKITLTHADTASTDVNRFVGVTNADVVIPAGGSVTLLYTVAESRWRVLAQVEPHVTRVQSVVSAATVTPNVDEADIVLVLKQAENITFANPSPSYTLVNGQKFILRIIDDGTARNIEWGDEYRAIQSSLPSITIAGKTLYLGFIYNTSGSTYGANLTWDLVANAQEPA